MVSKLTVDTIEWNQIWPEWVGTMNNLRSQRLEEDVYPFQRRAVVSAYDSYVTHPPPNTPAFDLLPHPADVTCFPPFRDIIRVLDGAYVDDKPFESTFAQLPELVDKWKKELDAEVAELVKIPPHLSSKGTCDDRVVASSSTIGSESSQTATDKLHLACALFRCNVCGPFTHFEVFSISMFCCDETDLERTGSIWDRYRIAYIAEAPHIIHACGLDPNVATVDDMDLRNARLKCLTCSDSRVRRWKDAVRPPFSLRDTRKINRSY